MRHKRAAQRDDGTGWHYVFGGRPIGYCADHDPHPTEADARDCYGRYIREQTIRLDVGTTGWTSCEFGMRRGRAARCPNPTQRYAKYGDDGYGMTSLCPEHMTVEGVIDAEGLEGPAGDAWIS